VLNLFEGVSLLLHLWLAIVIGPWNKPFSLGVEVVIFLVVVLPSSIFFSWKVYDFARPVTTPDGEVQDAGDCEDGMADKKAAASVTQSIELEEPVFLFISGQHQQTRHEIAANDLATAGPGNPHRTQL
jgi:hypothetical protein